MNLFSIPEADIQVWDIDVPGDNTCLFYSVALGYLLPVMAKNEEFSKRYKQLFGDEKTKEAVQQLHALLHQFNGDVSFINHNDNTGLLQALINHDFRNHVVQYMRQNKEEYKNLLALERTEGDMAHISEQDFDQYLSQMEKPQGAWGGLIEIKAMKKILGIPISIYKYNQAKELVRQEVTEEELTDSIIVLHTNSSNNREKENNHYHLLLRTAHLPCQPDKLGRRDLEKGIENSGCKVQKGPVDLYTEIEVQKEYLRKLQLCVNALNVLPKVESTTPTEQGGKRKEEYEPKQQFAYLSSKLKNFEGFLDDTKRDYFNKDLFNQHKRGLYPKLRANRLKRHVFLAEQWINKHKVAKNNKEQLNLATFQLAANALVQPLEDLLKTGVAILSGDSSVVTDVAPLKAAVNVVFSVPKLIKTIEANQLQLKASQLEFLGQANQQMGLVFNEFLNELTDLVSAKLWLINFRAYLESQFPLVMKEYLDYVRPNFLSFGHTHQESLKNSVNKLRVIFTDFSARRVDVLKELEDLENEHNKAIDLIIADLKFDTKLINAMQEGLEVYLMRKCKPQKTGISAAKKYNEEQKYGDKATKIHKALVQVFLVNQMKRSHRFRAIESTWRPLNIFCERNEEAERRWNPFNFTGNTPKKVMEKFCNIESKMVSNISGANTAVLFIKGALELLFREIKEKNPLELIKDNDFRNFIFAWVEGYFISYISTFMLNTEQEGQINHVDFLETLGGQAEYLEKATIQCDDGVLVVNNESLNSTNKFIEHLMMIANSRPIVSAPDKDSKVSDESVSGALNRCVDVPEVLFILSVTSVKTRGESEAPGIPKPHIPMFSMTAYKDVGNEGLKQRFANLTCEGVPPNDSQSITEKAIEFTDKQLGELRERGAHMEARGDVAGGMVQEFGNPTIKFGESIPASHSTSNTPLDDSSNALSFMPSPVESNRRFIRTVEERVKFVQADAKYTDDVDIVELCNSLNTRVTNCRKDLDEVNKEERDAIRKMVVELDYYKSLVDDKGLKKKP